MIKAKLLGHVAQVHICDCTSAKEEASGISWWLSFKTAMCTKTPSISQVSEYCDD